MTAASYWAAWRARHIAAGLCVKCNGLATRGQLCAIHGDEAVGHAHDYYARRCGERWTADPDARRRAILYRASVLGIRIRTFDHELLYCPLACRAALALDETEAPEVCELPALHPDPPVDDWRGAHAMRGAHGSERAA